jgi:hypothetical protein
MTNRHTADTINDNDLDQLYRERDAARRVLDPNDLSLVDEMIATVQQHMDRADRAEAALDRVHALHTRNENTDECEYCSARDYPDYAVPYPCDTVRALDGQEQPT